MKRGGKKLKIDAINKKILSIIHLQSNISNQELADKVGLSTSACFQRVRALKEEGYFLTFLSDLDMNRLVEHVLAYVDFTLENNGHKYRKIFEDEIQKHPEFMDCLRVTGDSDYTAYTCCSNTQELTDLVDTISKNEALGIKTVKIRMILGRAKSYLGFPMEKLKWLEE